MEDISTFTKTVVEYGENSDPFNSSNDVNWRWDFEMLQDTVTS
jgi:hypothetical protein